MTASNLSKQKPSATDRSDGAISQSDRRPLIVAGIVLGISQAGFFDGIVFHQLLQWHHMFSSVKTDATVAGLELNTLGDGLFHLFDWSMTLIGIFLLWRAVKIGVPLSTSTLIGSLLLGAGLFNVIEGVVDHHILAIHHVRSGSYQTAYDLGFLFISVLIILSGWWILRSRNSASTV